MSEERSDLEVLLVDDQDRPRGTAEKWEAHRKGLLHRAFSVLLFDEKGRLLLQKRADDKYHSGGLWTNTCCSHPFPDESVEEGAHRRLREEMGIDADLNKAFTTRYILDLGDGMTENELDHVFMGTSDQVPWSDRAEVMDQRYVNYEELNEELRNNPERFTEWFKVIWKEYLEWEEVGESEH